MAHEDLTPRESEILRLVGQAKANREIASILNLSVHTVGNHRKQICRKLGIHTTAELVAYALRREPGATSR